MILNDFYRILNHQNRVINMHGFEKFQCDIFGSKGIECSDCRRAFYLNEFRYIWYYIALILSIFIFINISTPDKAWICIFIIFGILIMNYFLERYIMKIAKKWNTAFNID